MQANQSTSNQKRYKKIQPHAGEDQGEDGYDAEDGEDGSIIDGEVEEDERDGAGKVEEEPGEYGEKEDDEGDRVVDEAEEEDKEGDAGVVASEVSKVTAQPGSGVGEGYRERESRYVEKLRPWPNGGGEGGAGG
ncbi:hypothetical protein Dimus_001188 [Dionaea muscipula]